MEKRLRDFLNISKSSIGEADRILEEILISIFNAIDELLGMRYQDYKSLNEMIDDGVEKKDQYSYFWSWLKDHGIDSLDKIISLSLNDTDNTLDILEDRMFIIELDIKNGIISSFFESIASTFTVIDQLISDELAASSCDILYEELSKRSVSTVG